MSDIESLKAAIAETNDALTQKVKILEASVKETASSIKDSVEQGAANVRSVANALSPVYQVKEHPYLVTGALLGLGVYLGTRSTRTRTSKNTVVHTASVKEHNPSPFQEAHNVSETAEATASTSAGQASKVRALAEPAVLGLFAAIGGEIVKRYFPKVESQATAVQSALISQMTGRIVQEFKAKSKKIN